MQKVETFHKYPSACLGCGTNEGPGFDLERWLDTGIDGFPSQFYMCLRCAGELAVLADFVPRDEVDYVYKAREAAVLEAIGQRERSEKLELVVKNLGDTGVAQRCGTCKWAGKSLAQHVRYCDIEFCPHQKIVDPEDENEMEEV